MENNRAEALAAIDSCEIGPEQRLEAAKTLAGFGDKPDLDAVCEIDLHTHSFCSDGYRSPTARVYEAWRRKMKALAIADHDVFDGQREALAAGKIFGIDVIPAIEFYTERGGVEIIGHFPDVARFLELLDSGAPDTVIEPIRRAKRVQLRGMMDRTPEAFRRHGLDLIITPEDEATLVRNGVSTKGDISVILWTKYGKLFAEKGLAPDIKVLQSRYTVNDAYLNLPLKIELDLSPAAFVRRIFFWGGLPGLPHPVELRNKEGLGNQALRDVIADLAAVGLQTLEVDGFRNKICPETGLPQTDLFERFRREYNAAHPDRLPLLFTNGSDDHDQPNEGLEMGCGRNRNLRPDFGRYENVLALRRRAEALRAKRE